MGWIRLQLMISVPGFTILTCDTTWLREAFESVRRIGPLAHLSALLIRGWTAAAWWVGWGGAHTQGEHIAPPDRPPGNRPLQGDEWGLRNFKNPPESKDLGQVPLRLNGQLKHLPGSDHLPPFHRKELLLPEPR